MYKHFEQCSQVTKKHIMKSTVKIDYQLRGNGGVSVIKIVQPIEFQKPLPPEEDHDPRDTMVSQFIQDPTNVNPNFLFERSTYYPYPFENPTHFITNIQPISNENLLYRLEIILKETIDEWKLDFETSKIESLFKEINEAPIIKNKIVDIVPSE